MKNTYNFNLHTLQVNKKIKFFLDRNWEGKGIVTKIMDNNTVVVKLTKFCKEFYTGSEIIVTKDEIFKIVEDFSCN